MKSWMILTALFSFLPHTALASEILVRGSFQQMNRAVLLLNSSLRNEIKEQAFVTDKVTKLIVNVRSKDSVKKQLKKLGYLVGENLPLYRADDWGKLSSGKKTAFIDPEIMAPEKESAGVDPGMRTQWGMTRINVGQAWTLFAGNDSVIVAVIDTGIDYNHEDLKSNMWRNPGETGIDKEGHDKATNNIDDDGNGYVDDIVGFDFFSRDNKPYDVVEDNGLGESSGHGTHCAGSIAARGFNGKGISGVSPLSRIMALRFMPQYHYGMTDKAVQAIDYAVKNGARIINASWGGYGDENDSENIILKAAIQDAADAGVLFVTAAGNGDADGVGDNIDEAMRFYPAAYRLPNIITVAASDYDDRLLEFSNFGKERVHIAAPGHMIMSTIPHDKYANDEVQWSGTSMAAPFVAGAAALLWSHEPGLTYSEVRDRILTRARRVDDLKNKIVSGGILDVAASIAP